MEYNEFKEAVITAAKAAGVKEYELYYRTDSEVCVEAIKKAVKGFSSAESGGVCFRCIVDGKMGYSGTELFTEEEAASLVARAVDNAASIESDEKVFIYDGKEDYQNAENPVLSYSSEQMIEDAVKLNTLTCEVDDKISDSSESAVIADTSNISIYNSNGLDLTATTSLALAYTSAIATDGEESSYGSHIAIGDLRILDMESASKDAAKTALAELHPGKVESGSKKVVFSGKMMSSMLATFVSVFDADQAQKGLSLLKGKENSMIASKELTLIDDPFYCDSTAKISFDAEGVATKRKEVIHEGVLTTLFYNLRTAHIAGVKSTGNASKESYDSSVSTSPYTFYVKTGSKTQDEIFEEVKDGLYITDIQGMHAGADAKTGDFSLAAGGYLITDGKKAGCVKGFTIAGNFYDMIKKITCVGDTLEFGMPRGLRWIGSPLVVVSDLSIAG